jgi:hypothetical protein
MASDNAMPLGWPSITPSVRSAKLAAMRAAITANKSSAQEAAPWEDRSPATLERFLRSRDYRVDVAAELFLEHRAWRTSLGWHVPESAVAQPYFSERKLAIQALSSKGKEPLSVGCPLLIIVARNHILEGRKMDEVRTAIVHVMDRIMDSLPPGGRFVVLLDLVGLQYRNADVQAILACFDMLQKFYVERVDAMWFLQPPTIFWALWKVVRPFIAAKTREKIHFVSSRDLPALALSRYEAADVPTEYGGRGELRVLQREPLPWEAKGLARRRQY